jgi:hypothetical protein
VETKVLSNFTLMLEDWEEECHHIATCSWLFLSPQFMVANFKLKTDMRTLLRELEKRT